MADSPGIAKASNTVGSTNKNCPFCNPSDEALVARNDNVVILWDGFPISPGHALVTPVHHAASWADLTRDEKIAMLDGIDTAQQAIEREHSPDGYNIGINDGIAAGQTIMHVHLHVIPRYTGDSEDPRGGIRWILPDKARYWEE